MKNRVTLAMCLVTFSGLAWAGAAQPDRGRDGGQPQRPDRAQQPGQAQPGRAEQPGQRRGQDEQRPGERIGQPGAAPPGAQGEMAQMMEAWQAAMTPGEQHRFLSQFVGEWRTTSRVFMGGPGSEPMVSQGRATFRMIMDGRFLQQEYHGEIMGQAFHGMGLTGYDNTRKQFIGTWMDSMSTSMSHFKGGIDPAGRLLTMYGEMDEPRTGEIGKPIRYLWRVEGPDRNIFEMQEVIYGEPFTVMELTYEREGTAAPAGRGGTGGGEGRGTPPGRGQDPAAPGRPR
jgi:hypothetical protein